MPRSRSSPLLPPARLLCSLVLLRDSPVLLRDSVLFLILGRVAHLTSAPEVSLVSLVSLVLLVSVPALTVLRVISLAALQPLTTAGLEPMATAGPEATTTATTGGETATMGCMSAAAAATMALPIAIPMTAATRPTAEAGALPFAPDIERIHQGHCTPIGLHRGAEEMDMKQRTRITAARVSLGQDDDGRQAARLVALSMGLLFSLIFVLQALSW
jgi:hypothetical protein